MIKAVILEKTGNIKDVKLKVSKINRSKDIKNYFKKFKKYINDKSKYDLELIDIWTTNGYNIVGYGISKGKDNTLNRHELLSTTNNNKYYGDILLIKTNKDNTIENLTSTEYEKCYNKFYGYYETDDNSNDSDDNSNLDEIDYSEDSDSSNTSYDEMYDSEEISDYETDNSDTEKETLTKNKNKTSKIKQTYIKELEYESYSSESD